MAIKLLSVCEGDVSDGLIGNIFASVAEWESDVNGQRTKDALAQKFRDGWLPTLYLGYKSVGGEDERKTYAPDPITGPLIKELFELYSTGNYSILDLQSWLYEKNITSKNSTPVSHDVINRILKNSFYFGLIRWHGEAKMGKHIPLITKQLFDLCQYVIAKHRNFITRKRKYDYLLRGFIFCTVCDQSYTAEPHPNHSTVNPMKIDYYHCQKRGKNGCPAPYVEQGELENQVEQEIAKMQFSEEFINKVVARTREVLDESRRTVGAQKQGLINQKSAIEAKRNKLEDMLLDGTIERDTFKRKHAELDDKIMNVDISIQNVENSAHIDINLIEEVLAFTRNIHQVYIEAPKFLKRHYLRFFFERIYVKDKQIYKVIPTPIFLILRDNHQVIVRTTELRD